MYYVYVLLSKKNGKRYIGYTSKEPLERLEEHNKGSNIFTQHNRPFELIYFEPQESMISARRREKFLKSGHGREFLKKKLSSVL